MIPRPRTALLLGLLLVFPAANSSAQTVVSGLAPLYDPGSADSWSGLFVMTSAITGPGGGADQGTITTFNYWAESGRADGSRRVTPILVENTAGTYRVVGVGTTRAPLSTGAKSEPFELASGTDQVDLSGGSTFHIAVLQQRDGGDNNSAGLIPFGNSGGGGMFVENTVGPNHVPVVNDMVGSDYASGSGGRIYSFNFEIEFTANPQPPTDIELVAGELFSGLPVGTGIGTLVSIDPNPGDTHSYELVANPGGVFAIDGDTLELDGVPGPVGTDYTIRVRSTDNEMLSVEKDFLLTVGAALPPSDLVLSATSLNAGLPAGALVGTLSTVDGNAGDRHTYLLVSGAGDTDNGFFTVANGNELRLAAAVPAGRTSLSFRLRTTDLSGEYYEEPLTIAVLDPSFRINEFAASNVNGPQDEDLQFSDWIEIQNEQGGTANLLGWYLTDDPDNLTKWQFPSVELGANEVVVVYASGQDRAVAGMELHTNFALASDGEFLALVKPDGLTIADQFSFARQYPDITFGHDGSGGSQGFLVPTPGAPNGSAFAYGANKVAFSRERGFYEAAFELTLTATVPGSVIRYTTNGAKPTAGSGTVYTGPIAIAPDPSGSDQGSRIVRAIAIHPSAAVQPVGTHTYLFVNGVSSPLVDGVLGQSVFQTSIRNDPTYGPLMDDALLAQPAISIVGGLPGTTEAERSIEFFTPDGSDPGFHVDCGVKVVGGHSVGSPKNNFRLYFRGEYGTSKLRYDLFKDHPFSTGAVDVFDRLNLRSGSHDSFFWLANPANPPNSGGPQKGDAQYLRNRWINDMQFLMGHESLHGRWVHVYVNGTYHGHYQLHEWPNDDFLASYLPGDPADYEYTNGASTAKSGSDNWQAIWSTVKSAAEARYSAAERWIDLENLVDYQILNFYAGNPWDWNPNQNWMAGGPSVVNSPSGGWKFFGWDSDICLQDPGANVLDSNVPDGLFQTLMNHEEFRILFRDRVYTHCFHDGVLTPARVQQFHTFRAEEIRTSIVAETARWQGGATSAPWDRDGEWQAELDRMANYFRRRTLILLNQLRAHSNWYPLEAPEFDVRGGFVAAGHTPLLSAPAGTIYYTTDGSDPRLRGGAINPAAAAFSPGSLEINTATVVRARVTDGSTWSALNEAGFIMAGTQMAVTSNVTISEIHYHPHDLESYEFIEFKNISAAAVDFSGVTISGAVNFTFPLGSVVSPGGHIVVVEDRAAFTSRYQNTASPWFFPGIVVAGEWSGALDNGGETIVVQDSSEDALLTMTFRDGGSWPGRADGRGSALELEDPGASPAILAERTEFLDRGDNWRSTSEFHGSPGRDGSGPDNRIVFNEILTNSDPPDLDAFELLNTRDAAIDIGGWFVSDDADDFRKFRIPAATSLDAGALLVFDEGDFNNPVNSDSLVRFALNGSRGDDLFLLEPDGAGNLLHFVDRAEFGAAAAGESFGRWPDGGRGEFYPMVMRTLGLPNESGGNGVRVGSVVVAEIHYNPGGVDAGLEFIAICNAGALSADLANWRLRGEADFDFPPGIVLAPGAFLVLVGFDPANPSAADSFRAEFRLDPLVPLVGPWTNDGAVGVTLSDGGGSVRLLRPDALVVPVNGEAPYYPMLIEDLVNYGDAAPWPSAPDGAGASLVRIDVLVYGDDPLNWEASGHPLSGASYATWAANTFPDGVPPAERLEEADYDRDGINNFGEFAFMLDALNGGGPPPTTAELTPDGDAILIRYRARPGAHDFNYEVGVSADLDSWDYSGNSLEFVSAMAGPDGAVEVTQRHSFPGDAPPRLFFRVQVAE